MIQIIASENDDFLLGLLIDNDKVVEWGSDLEKEELLELMKKIRNAIDNVVNTIDFSK
jgi:hypothetical protein